MSTITNFAKAAAHWNEVRYEQTFDFNLTINLLAEEIQEYSSAKDLVEQVDALADISFIAAGALWKLDIKFDEATFIAFNNYYLMEDIGIAEALHKVLYVMHNYQGLYHRACNLHQIIAACFDTMSYKLGSQDAALKALFCIVRSNNTKVTAKIDSNEKYSEEGKGSNYISPLAELTQLISELQNEVKH